MGLGEIRIHANGSFELSSRILNAVLLRGQNDPIVVMSGTGPQGFA